MYRKYLFFDLDGTLTDSMPGITRSVRYALERLGIEVPDLQSLVRFVGPPLKESFMTFYGMTAAEAERAIALTREYFVPKGMFENELYAGVPELLDATRRAGCVNVMATSKPEPFARQIAAHFGIDTRFELISGSSLDGSRTTKAEVIGHALRTLGITPEEAVMIGDRRHDIEGGPPQRASRRSASAGATPPRASWRLPGRPPSPTISTPCAACCSKDFPPDAGRGAERAPVRQGQERRLRTQCTPGSVFPGPSLQSVRDTIRKDDPYYCFSIKKDRLSDLFVTFAFGHGPTDNKLSPRRSLMQRTYDHQTRKSEQNL